MNRSRLSAECPVAEPAPEGAPAPDVAPAPVALPGFSGPLLLLSAGIVLGLAAMPGPAPDALTLASYGAALLTYAAGRYLARRGWDMAAAALVVLVALGLGLLAFGPSPLPDRKITAFNAWAFDLGAHLPPLFVPPPHPNAAAGVLAVALGLSGAAVLARRAWRRGAVALCLLLAGALLLTASRAGWLAAAALLVLLAGRKPRYTLTGMLLGGLALVGIMSAGQPMLPGESKVLSTYSLGVRLEQWQHTLALLEAGPLTGLGLGRYPAAYALAVSGTGQRPYETPANLALQLWADAGLPGVLAGGWAAWRVIRLVRAPATPGGGGAGWLVLGLGAALAALAVDGLFESVTIIAWKAGAGYGYLTSPLPFLLLGLLAGLRADGGAADAVTRHRRRRAERAASRRPRPDAAPSP